MLCWLHRIGVMCQAVLHKAKQEAQKCQGKPFTVNFSVSYPKNVWVDFFRPRSVQQNRWWQRMTAIKSLHNPHGQLASVTVSTGRWMITPDLDSHESCSIVIVMPLQEVPPKQGVGVVLRLYTDTVQWELNCTMQACLVKLQSFSNMAWSQSCEVHMTHIPPQAVQANSENASQRVQLKLTYPNFSYPKQPWLSDQASCHMCSRTHALQSMWKCATNTACWYINDCVEYSDKMDYPNTYDWRGQRENVPGSRSSKYLMPAAWSAGAVITRRGRQDIFRCSLLKTDQTEQNKWEHAWRNFEVCLSKKHKKSNRQQ